MLNMFQPRFNAVLEYCGLKTKRPWGTGQSVVHGPSRLIFYSLSIKSSIILKTREEILTYFLTMIFPDAMGIGGRRKADIM